MGTRRKFISGHVTRIDGTRVPLTEEEAAAIWAQCEAEKAARDESMPTTKEALTVICNAKQRLRDLGWGDACYCPKDGSTFAVIEYGSTGVFSAFYTGDLADGYLIVGNCTCNPAGAMWKPLANLTDAERRTMEDCAEMEPSSFPETPWRVATKR